MESFVTLIASLVAAIVCSAFFSAAETALTGVSREKIHKMKMEGNKRAKLVSDLREDKEKLIGALLLGNNALNIFASSLATSSAISLFGSEGVAYATVVMTVIILIFAEVLPKTYAFEHAERVALTSAPLLNVLVKLLYPIIATIQKIVNVTLHALGGKRDSSATDMLSATDALRGAIELHHHEGTVVKDDRDMLGSILDLADTEVGEIMVHRKNMVTLSVDQPVPQLIREALDSSHTRIPLWRDNPDNIIGILHVKDLLRFLRGYEGKLEDIDILKVASQPWFIPNTTTLSQQLHEFRRKRNHFALVIDEYGALMGVVTLEDILEEIVGQIEDEHDTNFQACELQADGSYLVDGDMSIRDFNRELGWELPADNATTLAGLLMYETETIPEVGEIHDYLDIRWEVIARAQNQLTRLKVKKREEEEER